MKSIPSHREVASLASWSCCKHWHNTLFVSHSFSLAGARLRLVFLFSGKRIRTQVVFFVFLNELCFKWELHFRLFPMTMTVCFIFHDIIFMHLRCVQGQSMFQKLLFDSQRLLLLGQHFNTVSVLHLKVATKPCVNLHMHNIMLMVRASCVLQVHVLVTFMSSSERAVLCGNKSRDNNSATGIAYLPEEGHN